MKAIWRTTDKRGDIIYNNRYYTQDERDKDYCPAPVTGRVEIREIHYVNTTRASIGLYDDDGKFIGRADDIGMPVTGTTHDRFLRVRTYRRGKYFFIEMNGEAVEFLDFRELVKCFERLNQEEGRRQHGIQEAE